MARKRVGTISVDIDIDDILGDLDDADVMAEVEARGLGTPTALGITVPCSATARGDEADYFDGWAEELRHAAHCSDWRHFDIVLNRMRPASQKVKT